MRTSAADDAACGRKIRGKELGGVGRFRRGMPVKKELPVSALFSFQRGFDCVFETADGVLNLSLDLVGLAFRLQLGVTGRLSDLGDGLCP